MLYQGCYIEGITQNIRYLKVKDIKYFFSSDIYQNSNIKNAL